MNLKLPYTLITAATSMPERAASAPAAPGAPAAGPGTVPLTRPLCAYPQLAQYRGSGDVNDAANFVCAAPSSR
jgi:feruloyl esterase